MFKSRADRLQKKFDAATKLVQNEILDFKEDEIFNYDFQKDGPLEIEISELQSLMERRSDGKKRRVSLKLNITVTELIELEV